MNTTNTVFIPSPTAQEKANLIRKAFISKGGVKIGAMNIREFQQVLSCLSGAVGGVN